MENVLKLINNSLLLDIPTKERLRLMLKTLTDEQIEKLISILEQGKEKLGELLKDSLKNPAKKDVYEEFMRFLSMEQKQVYKEQEIILEKEDAEVLDDIESELINL